MLAALLCCSAWFASASDRYDPRLRFRTLRTAHFDIHAHQGEEAMARRLAGIVERVRLKFEPVFGVARGRVQIILVDQTDLSNGFATPVPYDTIEITAVPPSAETLIGNTTDWLELVFTHEYTHILHLDRTRGVMEGVRRVFGRVPVAFPNTYLPVWQIEGLATFEESRMTGEGRIPAGDFRAIVDVAAARGRFETIDRASGGLDDWPDGNAAYAYGAYFHQYLADRYGAERLSQLADATAGRLPLVGAGAFTKVFGESVGALWQDFRRAREGTPLPRSETDARATQLTHHGFTVTAPRPDPGDASGRTFYYETAGPDGFPALMRIAPGTAPQRVAWRVLGNRTSVRGGWIVFDQLQEVRSIALYSDLYAVRTTGGALHRLTADARAADPDLSPDARRIVCTVQATGRRAIALLGFSPTARGRPTVIVDDPAADYTGPRWSPDGRQIVAERRRSGAYDLVLIDPDTHAVRPLVERHDARLVTPSWTPDGATILFSADLSAAASAKADGGDAPFNVFAVDVATGRVRQVTDTAGGAQAPELSARGTLTYVGYTPNGYDLFSVPTASSEWKTVPFESGGVELQPEDQVVRLKAEATREAEAPSEASMSEASARGADATRDAAQDPAGVRDHSYRPWRTLVPTFWTPVIQSDNGETIIGAGTAMFDALGRHAYAVDAGWAAGRARPDWHAAYAYDRWRPKLVASYSDETDPVRGGTVRSRELFAGALLPFRHIRWSDTLLGGFDAETDGVACTAGCPVRADRQLRSLRVGWLHDSRRLFGYSVSVEEGLAIEAAAEASRTALGSDADAGAAVFDARAFHRLGGRHTVLAARIAAATAWGDPTARRIFSAAGPGPSSPGFSFGRDTIGLLRGFAPGDVVGSRAAAANVDLRFPLARLERGVGSWPVFFRALHAAAFLDAGTAWDTSLRTADLRTSLGGELSLDLVFAHSVPLTMVTGAAWTRDPIATVPNRAALFGRIGYAF